MQKFVRFGLSKQQMRSPQLLASSTERQLEQEIENNRTVVVGGDGSELSSSREEVENFGKESQMIKTDGSEDSSGNTSWIKTPVWQKRASRTDIDGAIDRTAPSISRASSRSSLVSSPIVPRRNQSTSSLVANFKFDLHFGKGQDWSRCSTPPPHSPQHNFQFAITSCPPTPPSYNKQRLHKRSQSSNCSAPLSLSGSTVLQQSVPAQPPRKRKQSLSLSFSTRSR